MTRAASNATAAKIGGLVAQDPAVFQVDSRSLYERVYQQIRLALSQGLFAEGEVLTTRGLAATFGTSEMPIREALRRLIAEKFILQLSNRSYQVPQLSMSAFQDVISVRMVLESFGASLAASKATPRDVAHLRSLNDEMRRAIQEHRSTDTLRLNEEFHFGIYRIAGSETLLETVESLWARSGPYLATMGAASPELRLFAKAAEMHEHIIAAIEQKNEEAAKQALLADIGFAVEWYKDLKSK